MGLKISGLEILKKVLPVESVLCLSYPDLVCTCEEVEKLFGYKPEKTTDFGAWHGKDFPLPDTQEFFEKAGVKTVSYVDIYASRGCEEIVDLNQPQDLGQFDLVIDPGTTEHCFNVGYAVANAAMAVKKDGFIFHTPPISMINHGFWNFSPTAFWDFYTQNGWKVQGMWIQSGNDVLPCPATKRFQVKPESSIYCLAQRLTDDKIGWPTQSKYLANPNLK